MVASWPRARPGPIRSLPPADRIGVAGRAIHRRRGKMRRLLVLLAILGSAGAVLLPMAAQATTTQTIHLTGVPIDVGPAGCVPGDLMISGNGVLHMTVNNAGDFWETGTVEGAATATGFTGHAVAWFGVEDNAQNVVNHFIANAVGTLADGASLTIHQEGQFTVNANGIPTVTRVTTTCG